MDENIYISWIQQELNGTLSPDEKVKLSQWLASSPNNRSLYLKIIEAYNLDTEANHGMSINVEEDYSKLTQRISAGSGARKKLPMRLMSLAAGIFFLILAGYFAIDKFNTPKAAAFIADRNNYSVTLPDGSIALLSKGSHLSYGKEFQSQRKIKIKGSVYLDVTHQEDNPFVVLGPSLKTSVLGTKFYMSDNAEEEGHVALIEGKLRVEKLATDNSYEISSGETIHTKDGKLLKLNRLYLEKYQWDEQLLNFQNASLSDIQERLIAVFNINFEVEKHLLECRFTGNFSGQQPKTIARSIAKVFSAFLLMQENHYELTGGQCE